MNITPLASGSSGNCYHVTTAKGDGLLLECGISFPRIREGLKFRTTSLSAVMISHAHLDHSKAAQSLMKAGIDCYASQPTIDALSLSGHRIHALKAREMIVVNGWTVLPFQTEHDCAGSMGFLIQAGGEKLLYASDSYYIRHRFVGLNYIMLEVNYADDILAENTRAGEVHRSLRKRIRGSHMSLETAKEFFKANDLSQVREIWLLHLSDSNSDAERFKREMQETTGKIVKIA